MRDGKFKKIVLDETPEKVVLTKVIREYLQCIGDIHKLVRSHVVERAEQARAMIQQHLSAYSAVNNGVVIGLAAIRGELGQQEAVPLLLDWDDVRIKLMTRNSTLTTLGHDFVTSRSSLSSNK